MYVWIKNALICLITELQISFFCAHTRNRPNLSRMPTLNVVRTFTESMSMSLLLPEQKSEWGLGLYKKNCIDLVNARESHFPGDIDLQ